jgi:outer membrane protein assembly factor BamA
MTGLGKPKPRRLGFAQAAAKQMLTVIPKAFLVRWPKLRAREPGTFRARLFPQGARARAHVIARRDRSLLDWFGRAPRTGLALLALFGLLMPAAVGAPTPSPSAAPTPVPATAAPATAAPASAAPATAAPAPAAPVPAAPAAPAVAPNVVDVSVTGNTHVPTDRILAVVHTKVGQPFDPAVVTDDLRAINDLGYFADQAPPVIRQRPDGVAVTFRVVENPVVTSIRFQGNKAVPADTLSALMDTATGQVFNLKTYQEDVLKINSYYDKIGYGGQVPSHVTDVNIDTSGVLTLTIQEGLTVRHIIIVQPPDADPVLPARLITQALVTKEGSSYSESQRDKDVEKLKDLYKQYDLTIGDFEAGIDPATVDTKAGTADVRYAISVARIGAIEITGNTTTHDDVIRRELRLKPGMLVTDSGVRNDYNRINNLGFFDKVDVTSNPGPDPKKPAYVTLKWTVKEQRTGTAQIGAGYSGGLTGTGLTGNISYSQNNINGTGNGASIKLEKGTQVGDAELSFTVPYLGNTVNSNKYSFGATIFTQAQTNYYPVYQSTPAPAPGITSTPIPVGLPIPVSIVPTDPTNFVLESGVAATYKTASTGVNGTLGRRLSDYVRASLGASLSEVQASATVPAPFFFPTSQNLSPLALGTANPFNGTNSASNAIGISAPSLAQINSSAPYALHSLTFGVGADTRDDIQNPRSGWDSSITDEVSSTAFGSAFDYSQITFDVARFFPVLKRSTFGAHFRYGVTDGAIPVNKLYTFSDQQLRGYTNPFYGTNIALIQAELRYPLTADRKFSLVIFGDDGATRIVGGQQLNSDSTTTDLNSFIWHADAGVGVRFDVPQLGLRTLRLDFGKGSLGTHISFGIGQAF